MNLGGIAAMAELLIQSDENGMTLLPALPTAWRDGRVTGLRTRCGYTVDMTWKKGELTEAVLKTENREAVSVKIGNTVLDVLPDKSDTIRIVKKEGTYVSDRSFDL